MMAECEHAEALRAEMKVLAMEEIRQHLTSCPTISLVDEIRRDLKAQSALVISMKASWDAFFGNGSGREGYWDRARTADKAQLKALSESVQALMDRSLLESGEAKGRKDAVLEVKETAKARFALFRDKSNIALALLTLLGGSELLKACGPVLRGFFAIVKAAVSK